jgi:phage baseplate assembly protein W
MKGVAFYDKDFLEIKSDTDLIFENITRILLTLPGERVANVEFGCKLKSFIFESATVLQEDVDEEIKASITKWEPRVKVASVSAKIKDENKVYIKLDLINRESLKEFNYETIISY